MNIVTPELGIFLKKNGFQEDCNAYRWDPTYEGIIRNGSNTKSLHSHYEKINHSYLPTRVSAPTYFEVLNWLRRDYFIHIYCRYECSVNEVIDFYYTIDFMINALKISNEIVESIDMDEEKTLIKAIEIALTKIKLKT